MKNADYVQTSIDQYILVKFSHLKLSTLENKTTHDCSLQSVDLVAFFILYLLIATSLQTMFILPQVKMSTK